MQLHCPCFLFWVDLPGWHDRNRFAHGLEQDEQDLQDWFWRRSFEDLQILLILSEFFYIRQRRQQRKTIRSKILRSLRFLLFKSSPTRQVHSVLSLRSSLF